MQQPTLTFSDRAWWVGAAFAFGSIALLCNSKRVDSRRAFRIVARIWTAFAAPLLLVYGIGLILVPLAASYRLAARAARPSVSS